MTGCIMDILGPDFDRLCDGEPMEHFNKLSPAEAERLAYLIEELAEAQQDACKILRHGYDSFNPDDPHHQGNRAALTKELNDVASAIKKMIQAGDLTSDPLGNSYPGKGAKYMHHQNGN